MSTLKENPDVHTATLIDPHRFVPLPRWDMRVRAEHGTGVVELDDLEFHMDGIGGQELCHVISSCDGRRTVGEVAAEAGVPAGVAVALIEGLLSHNLVVDAATETDETVDPESFIDACHRLYPVWKERLAQHPLWQALLSGEAPRSIFLGWLLESYHFIDGVNARLALAVTECTDPRVWPLFIKHYTEEYDHAYFFMKSLNTFGISTEAVRASRPLPSTLAVLDHARYCARRGPLEYSVCSGFLESTGIDRDNAYTFFDALEKHYAADYPDGIKPLDEHLRLDAAYQHANMMEKICRLLGPLPREQASFALNCGALFLETLELWCTDIMRTYADANSVPRISLHQYR